MRSLETTKTTRVLTSARRASSRTSSRVTPSTRVTARPRASRLWGREGATAMTRRTKTSNTSYTRRSGWTWKKRNKRSETVWKQTRADHAPLRVTTRVAHLPPTGPFTHEIFHAILTRFRVVNAPYATLHESIAWIGKLAPLFPISAHLAAFGRSVSRLQTRAG